MKAQALSAQAYKPAANRTAAHTTLRRVINLAKRAARGVFAPNFSMAVSAVGAAGVYFSAVIGHDMAAAAFTFAVMPWLMAAICHNPSAKKGGEI